MDELLTRVSNKIGAIISFFKSHDTFLNKNTIRVENFGIKYNGQVKSIKGSAKFIDKRNKNTGHLKVTFFKPFYGSYIIFYLEKENPNDN